MELELTVLEGGRLTWQGSAVQGQVDLTPGSIVRARCRYARGSVELERVLEVVHRSVSADGGLHSLASRGLLHEVVAATDSSDAPDVLGFRGRALIELGRLTEGVEVLQRALAGSGPSCAVDDWNSPWAAWAELTFEQKREVISRPFLTAVTRWAWLATTRGPGSWLHPALHVLAGLSSLEAAAGVAANAVAPSAAPVDEHAPGGRPPAAVTGDVVGAQQSEGGATRGTRPPTAGPWHAAGPAPVVFDARVLCRRVMPWLRSVLVGPRFERERLIVDAVLAGDWAGASGLEGPVADPLRQAVQALARGALTGELELAEVTPALVGLPGALEAFVTAMDVAELATLVPDVDHVERVWFRGFVSVRRPPVIVVARLRDGPWRSVVQRRGLQVTHGQLDDALAAVPELHFELAIAATAKAR